MRHRGKVVCITAALWASGAQASDSSVTLYGLIDATVALRTNTARGGGTSIGMGVQGEPWFSGSRWGMRGNESLGAGWNVVFRLESEFRIADGRSSDPTRLFDRAAWVGLLSDDWGRVTIGYQNALARDIAGIYADPYGQASLGYDESGWTSRNNFKQLIFYGGTDSGTRHGQSIVWKKLFSNGLLIGADYSMDDPNRPGFSTTHSVGAGYNSGWFNMSSFFNEVVDRGAHERAFSLGGNVTSGIVRVNAGYFHYWAEQPSLGRRKDDAWTVSVKLTPSGPVDYHLGYEQFHINNAAFAADGSTANALQPYVTTRGTASGYKEVVYASAFYHLSKRTELYAATDYMRLHREFVVAQTYGATSQMELALGMRTRF